jgi:hypothetical protein
MRSFTKGDASLGEYVAIATLSDGFDGVNDAIQFWRQSREPLPLAATP